MAAKRHLILSDLIAGKTFSAVPSPGARPGPEASESVAIEFGLNTTIVNEAPKMKPEGSFLPPHC